MRIIFKIAGAELRSLFYSPVAWVIAITFFVACGLQFADPLVDIAAVQQFRIDNMPGWKGFDIPLTHNLFDQSYKFLFENLYLFIPLLTMGAISREVHSGTINLLNSSPVTTRQIVLGKYLGLAVYNMILMIPIALILLTGYFSIISPDYKVFFTVLFGIYLLTCTYSAIGLFVSSLTNYQVVAALLTIMVFLVLTIMPNLWQQYDLVRDLTYFLNLSGRVDFLMTGLITTRDVSYFILIIGLFIVFTLVKLKSRKESKPWYVHFIRYLGVFAFVLLLGYITNRPAHCGYLDVSRGRINTIHPATQEAINELGDDTLQVTLYTNLLDQSFINGLPAARNDYLWNLWGKYLRFHPNTTFKFVYYYDLVDGDSSFFKQYPNKTAREIAERIMRFNGLPKSIFKTPAEIRKIIDLDDEGKRVVMQLEYKGRKTFLRTYGDMQFWPDQLHFSAAFRRLSRDTIPLILFTSGHYERSAFKSGEREYADHTLNKLSRAALLNQGVDVDSINLSTDEIPPSTSILVVADPKSALSSAEQDKIRSYINNGGNAIFYGEPGKQQMLNPILGSLGITLEDGILVAPNPHDMAHFTMNKLTDAAGRLGLEPLLFEYQQGKGELPPMILSGSANIIYKQDSGAHVKELFQPADEYSTWIERGYFVADSAAPVFSIAEGDIKRDKFTTSISLSQKIRNKEQRIVVAGDADFMSAFRGSGSFLGNAMYSWALYNEYPAYTNYPPHKDKLLTINRRQSKGLWVVFVYIIPGIVFAMGAVFLIRRRRK